MGGKLAEGLREFVEQKIKTEREEFEDKLRELVVWHPISFSNYKSRAKSKNWEFSLTKEEFSGLSLSNCHYCNQEPPKS